MSADATARQKALSIAVLVATALTIVFNGLAASGLNGVSAGEVSAKYPTILTPAGYAFSIWSLIYLGLAIFSVLQAIPSYSSRFDGIRILYLVSCLLNCSWLYFWHHDWIAACALTIVVLATALVILLRRIPRGRTFPEAAATTAVFGIYGGWVTCASLVNIIIFLSTRGVDPRSLTLGVTAVIVAVAAAILVRWRLRNYLYPLAVAWALGAIAVSQSGNTAIVIATVFGTVAALVISGSVVVELQDSTSGKG